MDITQIILKSQDDIIKKLLTKYLFHETLKPYSFVTKCTELSNTAKSVIDSQKAPDNIKIMWFKLLDNEMCKS